MRLKTRVGLAYQFAEGHFARSQSFRAGSRRGREFSGNPGGLASQLQFQRRLHELSDSRPEPFKIADIPGQQNICPGFQGAMGNERIIGGCTDDGPRGSQLKSGNIFLLAESELLKDLLVLN